MSHERIMVAGADVFCVHGRQHGSAVWPGACRPAGVEEQGMSPEGFPRNLGEPIVSTESEHAVKWGIANRKVPWPWREVPDLCGSENTVLGVVPPSEGNEVRREGRR